MDEGKVEEALTEWLDDESEHAAADFGARFGSDHYDMTEMAIGFYAGYIAASKQGAEEVLRGCIGCKDRLSCVMLVCDITLDDDGVPTCWTAPRSAPEASCANCTEYDSCRYQGPEVCGDFVRKIPESAQAFPRDCPPITPGAIDKCNPVQSAPSEEELTTGQEIVVGYLGRQIEGETMGDLAAEIDAALRAQLVERTRGRENGSAALLEAETTICQLCKRVNPQHASCKSCDEIERYRAARAALDGKEKE